MGNIIFIKINVASGHENKKIRKRCVLGTELFLVSESDRMGREGAVGDRTEAAIFENGEYNDNRSYDRL